MRIFGFSLQWSSSPLFWRYFDIEMATTSIDEKNSNIEVIHQNFVEVLPCQKWKRCNRNETLKICVQFLFQFRQKPKFVYISCEMRTWTTLNLTNAKYWKNKQTVNNANRKSQRDMKTNRARRFAQWSTVIYFFHRKNNKWLWNNKQLVLDKFFPQNLRNNGMIFW